MDDHLINNFEKLWPQHKIFYLDRDFPIIFKILSSDKLKNENPQTVWQVMHDWMNHDETKNRLTHFKILIIKCLQTEKLQFQFVENNIFQSDIFRLLPLEFQQNLKRFIINTKPLLVCMDRYDGSVEFYNPQHNSWHISPISLSKRENSFKFALLGNKLYAFGGQESDDFNNKKMWSRNLSYPSSRWKIRAYMKQSRRWFASVVLNDTIYALGGRDTHNLSFRSCERYCSQLNEWSKVADMNCDRASASAAVINGCIYVAGGENEQWKVLKSVSKYCPETDTWREVAPMTTQRWLFALTPFAGRLWAIGGVDGDRHPLSSCESYDPVTDTWREEAPLKGERYGHAAIEFNGELYVVGGYGKKDPTNMVQKYVHPKGWVEDSELQLQRIRKNPKLLIIPPVFSSFFTTDPKKKSINKNYN